MKHTLNNFDFLRFVAATLVVFSHCYPLSGSAVEPFVKFTGIETGGAIAVGIFFVISGFLIASSYQAQPKARIFFWKRSLRIFPAFWGSVLFCALIVGPLFTVLPLGDYFSSHEFWQFLRNARLFVLHLLLPGVFENNPNPAVNGSWWTLPMEFSMYIFLFIAGKGGVLTRKWLWVIVMGLFTWHLLIPPDTKAHFFHMPLFHFSRNSALFFAGSLLFHYRYVLERQRPWYAFGLAGLSFLLFRDFHGLSASYPLVDYLIFYAYFPYLVIYFALHSIPFIRDWARFGDFSYGIYLYAFPVQQSLVYLHWAQGSTVMLFAASMAIILPLAAASWHFIEKPALRCKPRSTS